MEHTLIELAVYKGGGEPPSELRLFGAGSNETAKGTFVFDDAAAAMVLAHYADAGNELHFDFDHKSLLDGAPPSHGEAAGWFQLEARAGELWATNIRWTEETAAALQARKWRYISPAFVADDESNRVLRMINCALTNRPATKRMKPIMNTTGETIGDEPPKGQNMQEIAKKLNCDATELACILALDKREGDLTDAKGKASVLASACKVVGLSESATGDEFKSKLVELTALAARVPTLETDIVALRANLDGRLAAEAEAEVDFVVTNAAMFKLGIPDTKEAREMLLSQRTAAPESFAKVYKPALDARRVNQPAHLMQTLTEGRGALSASPTTLATQSHTLSTDDIFDRQVDEYMVKNNVVRSEAIMRLSVQ